MNGDTAARHLDDGQLMRYVDDEAPPVERSHWQSHLAVCERCAGEVARLRDRSALVSGWLERADFEEHRPDSTPGASGVAPPWKVSPARQPGWRPWLKAAAVIVLVAGPLAALPPVRNFVADRLAAPNPPTPTAVRAETTPQPVVRFVPEPGVLTIRLEGTGEADLAIGRTAGTEARLDLGGARSEAVVSSTGVRLTGGSGEAYSLRVPRSITRVEVVTGDRTVVLESDQIDRGWRSGG